MGDHGLGVTGAEKDGRGWGLVVTVGIRGRMKDDSWFVTETDRDDGGCVSVCLCDRRGK